MCKFSDGAQRIKSDLDIQFEKMITTYDRNKIELFRIVVQNVDHSIVDSVRKLTELENVPLKMDTFSKNFRVSFKKIDFEYADNSMLDQRQLYIVSSPFTLYFWVGREALRNTEGAIYIFKEFLNRYVQEYVAYLPSYMDDEHNLGLMKFKVIFQGAETNRFKSLFSRWTELNLDYLMMRVKKPVTEDGRVRRETTSKKDNVRESLKVTEIIEEDEEEEDKEITDFLLAKNEPVKTTIARPSNLSANSAIINLSSRSHQSEDSMQRTRQAKNTGAQYRPNSVLAALPGQKIRANEVDLEYLHVCEIEGRRYNKNKSLIEKTIFDSSKSYFIVLGEDVADKKTYGFDNNNAIYLWRGASSTMDF